MALTLLQPVMIADDEPDTHRHRRFWLWYTLVYTRYTPVLTYSGHGPGASFGVAGA